MAEHKYPATLPPARQQAIEDILSRLRHELTQAHVAAAEWEPMTEAYTGDVTHATVTYVLRGGPWLPDGYVCMGIECEALAWALRYARRWACHDGALDQALQVYERGKQ